jgi:tRNA-dihydrouridine synthase
MKEPFTVIKILNSLYDSGVKIPITLKIRIGVDDLDAPGFLENFVINYY